MVGCDTNFPAHHLAQQYVIAMIVDVPVVHIQLPGLVFRSRISPLLREAQNPFNSHPMQREHSVVIVALP